MRLGQRGTSPHEGKRVRKNSSTVMKARWNSPWREERIKQMQGHSVSEKTLSALAEHNKVMQQAGHTEEAKRLMSERKGGIKLKTLPFLLRGALVEEVVQITELEKEQVRNVQSRLRTRGRLQKPTRGETRRVKQKAFIGKKRVGNTFIKEFSEREQKGFALARKFWEEGFISEDLSSWNRLHGIYAESQRDLPYSYADRLRLEVFLAVLDAWGKSNGAFLSKYRELCDAVDPSWSKQFAPDEMFIAIKLFSPWAEGEDTKGLYSIVDGRRQYQVVGNGEGEMYDKSGLAIRRFQQRYRIGLARKNGGSSSGK